MDTLKGIIWGALGVLLLALLCLAGLQIIYIVPMFFRTEPVTAYLVGRLMGGILIFVLLTWGAQNAWQRSFKWFHHDTGDTGHHKHFIHH